MRVDTICSKMGVETNKSCDDISPNLYLDFQKMKNELECEKKLRQKMAERVSTLEKLLAEEKKKTSDLKFIRENDNQEIIRLEG